MIQEPSEFDIATLKFEMRQMYRHLGFDGSIQVLAEMLIGARALAEVIVEERTKDGN